MAQSAIRWYIKNQTNNYLVIGDLLLLPELPPKGVIDLLQYYEMNDIRHSEILNNLLNSGVLSMRKVYENLNENLRPVDAEDVDSV